VDIKDRDDAAEHLDAVKISEATWVYLPDEVATHYTVTSQDLTDLGRDLRTGQPDAYSLWCSMCGEESTEAEIFRYLGIQADPITPKLTIELVPKGQWGSNLRSELPKAKWDALRKECYKTAGNKCEICGGRGPKWPVECHEKWHYCDETKNQTLTGLIALCPSCHAVKHFGRCTAIGNGDKALAHLRKINDWTEAQANLYVADAFGLWAHRSRENWSLDLTWLDTKF